MEEHAQLKNDLLKVTVELISPCKFCIAISSDPNDKTPINCIKFSGSPFPINVNVATCLSCGEYKRAPDRSGAEQNS